jgi:hypothetical protein
MVHNGEIVIKASEGGEWIFLNQEGRPYKGGYREHAPVYAWNDVHGVHEAQGIYINSSTAVTRWRGERMDYDMALMCLFAKVERERRFRGNVEAIV